MLSSGLFCFSGDESYRRKVTATNEKAGLVARRFSENFTMSLLKAAQGRRARSVCIVTDKPVRLQAKSHRITGWFVETQIVRIGNAVLRIRLTATGEIVIDEPP